MTLSSPTQVLSSRPEGRVVCGPQWRDRGTIAPILSTLSFRAERPDFFFRAVLCRFGSRGARPFPSPFLVAPMIIQRPTSAGGAQEVSPARKGWVPVSTIFPSAVGAAPSSFAQSLSSRPQGRVLCGPQRVLCAPCGSPGWRDQGTSASTPPAPSFRAERGIPLCLSPVTSLLNFPFFSSSAFPLRTLRLCVIFFFLFLSTFNSELSTPEPIFP